MRRKIILFAGSLFLFLFSVLGAPNAFVSKAQLSGKITDKVSGRSLPGVIIYFPNLKTDN